MHHTVLQCLYGWGDKNEKLNNLQAAPLTIPPSSIEAERKCSATGLFSTKFQSCLSEQNLNIVCFFRSYFFNIKS